MDQTHGVTNLISKVTKQARSQDFFFVGGGGGGGREKGVRTSINRDQITNVLNDTLC